MSYPQEWLGEDIESITEVTEQEFLQHPVINYIKSDDLKKEVIDDLDAEVRYDDPANII